jgi:hypothetical protein
MCETNNSDNSELCFICFTSKVDSKKYLDRLNNLSYIDNGDVKTPINSSVKCSSPTKSAISKSESHKTKTSESVEKRSTEPKLHGDSKDWVDSLEYRLKNRKEKMRIVNSCSAFERFFMIILSVATIIFLAVGMNRNILECKSILGVKGMYFIIPEIVQLYLSIRGVTILNVGQVKKIFIKIMIWLLIHLIFFITALIGLMIIRLP